MPAVLRCLFRILQTLLLERVEAFLEGGGEVAGFVPDDL